MRFYGGCGAHGAPSNYIMLLPNGLWTPSPGGLDLNNGVRRLDIAGAAPGQKLYRINATVAHLYLVNIRMGLVKLRGQGALGELCRQPPLPKQCAQSAVTHGVLCPCTHIETTVSCWQFAPALGASRKQHKTTSLWHVRCCGQVGEREGVRLWQQMESRCAVHRAKRT